MCSSDLAEIEEGGGFSKVPAWAMFSPELVANVEGLLVTLPYFSLADPRIAGKADAQYTFRLARLETADDEAFAAFLKRKTEEWYKKRESLGTIASSNVGDGVTKMVALAQAQAQAQAPSSPCGWSKCDLSCDECVLTEQYSTVSIVGSAISSNEKHVDSM